MNRKVLENPENRDPWVVALAAALCAVVSVLGALAQSTKPATQSTHSTDSVLVPGRFVDITDKVGVHFLHQAPHTNRKYLIETMGSGVALFDCDNDGRIDLFNANDSMQEFLFHQKVDGTFEEIGLESKVAVNSEGHTYVRMGVDFADYDNDGWPDIVVTDLANQVRHLPQRPGRSLRLRVERQWSRSDDASAFRLGSSTS
jgi:hypothetical protein